MRDEDGDLHVDRFFSDQEKSFLIFISFVQAASGKKKSVVIVNRHLRLLPISAFSMLPSNSVRVRLIGMQINWRHSLWILAGGAGRDVDRARIRNIVMQPRFNACLKLLHLFSNYIIRS